MGHEEGRGDHREDEPDDQPGISRRAFLATGIVVGVGGVAVGAVGSTVLPSLVGNSDCAEPPVAPQPKTINVGQPTPVVVDVTDAPAWTDGGRPPLSSPGELPWFRTKITDLGKGHPKFGPRKDESLPFLLVRAGSGDRGGRPYESVFWESPDIFVVPNQEPSSAPLMPTGTAGVAQAGRPNTLYAHVWNLGRAAAYRVRVEFYWFNPSLGFSRSAANLIGTTHIDLADRFTSSSTWTEMRTEYGHWLSRGCHAVVRCPVTWVPAYVNSGHECLVVRASDAFLDPVPLDQFSPQTDRHVGQRNIAVAQAASPATLDLTLDLGWHPQPAVAEVTVELASPSRMEWLSLFTQRRDAGFTAPSSRVSAGLNNPARRGTAPRDVRLAGRRIFDRGCDPLSINLHASCDHMERNQAQVVRVRQRIGGELIGGYSVVLMGSQQ